MKKICSNLINLMESIKQKHENAHVNFDEVRNKVAKEYMVAKEEFRNGKLYPQLVYKFYFISSMFEVLTVYDIDIKLKENYLNQSKQAQ